MLGLLLRFQTLFIGMLFWNPFFKYHLVNNVEFMLCEMGLLG